jgi:hypothetical protein
MQVVAVFEQAQVKVDPVVLREQYRAWVKAGAK